MTEFRTCSTVTALKIAKALPLLRHELPSFKGLIACINFKSNTVTMIGLFSKYSTLKTTLHGIYSRVVKHFSEVLLSVPVTEKFTLHYGHYDNVNVGKIQLKVYGQRKPKQAHVFLVSILTVMLLMVIHWWLADLLWMC